MRLKYFAKSDVEVVRIIGIALFVLSFIPGWPAFVQAPGAVLRYFDSDSAGGDWKGSAIGLVLALGWLDNFTVLFRLPRPLSWIAILAPWFLFAALLFLDRYPSLNLWVVHYWPFYLWAAGIACIHGSRLQNPSRAQTPPSKQEA